MSSSSSSSSWHVQSSFLFILVVVQCVDARFELPPNVTFPAIIGFGDSIIDPGNNNHIKTLLKCNFPPYGRDFAGQRPTGRFTNGRIPTDFVAQELGIKEYVPAYLDPNLKPEELLTGVSFASGGSGYDPLTPTIVSVISLPQQLNLFKEYIGKLNKIAGEEKAKSIISSSVYAIVAGSDDIANTYFGTPYARNPSYDFESYSDLMVGSASSFVQNLYNLGARRIAVFSAPPIGCVPAQRSLMGGPARMCAEHENQLALLFNAKLEAQLASMKTQLPESRLVYVDIYSTLQDIVEFPAKYGLEEVVKGCCGTGLVEVAVLCNSESGACRDPAKYLFWDSFHPTDKGYQILTQIILQKYVTSLI